MATGAEGKNKDRQMAAHLLQSGYPHGRRMTTGHCPVCHKPGSVHKFPPGCPEVEGSTKMRRYKEGNAG